MGGGGGGGVVRNFKHVLGKMPAGFLEINLEEKGNKLRNLSVLLCEYCQCQ